MAAKKRKQLSAATIAADRAFLEKLKKLPDYAPTDPALSIEAVCAIEEKLCKAEEAVLRSEKIYAHACAAATVAKMALLNIIYGGEPIESELPDDEPDIAQVFGQKKKADGPRPARRRTTPSA